ncbi:helix-turn-helix transcriptional regulator [Novosphingobium aureum]|uniref:helix-turn-helix transcriptional regulator n=1 Tax=Novosphingobium aureum TaxID=2792964 RepID=UPI002B48E767|nr:helix-turn-helix transcriptional regulator [Novosphingobium aureum]
MPVVNDECDARDIYEGLTAKQVEVLDLLVAHRTTKEISRELGIAPNTVDQRIAAVRDKWGTSNRKDTARRYAEIRELCGKPICGFSYLDPEAQTAESLGQDLPVDPHFVLSDARPMELPMGSFQGWFEDTPEPLAGLEAFDRKFGRFGRLGMILVLALLMAMTLATVLAIADVMGRLL